MQFNRHSELAGRHATISASKYHWIRYTNEKFIQWVHTQMQAARGSELHNLAAMLIKMGQKLPRNGTTMSRYVNDCIGFRMNPEQVLFYSPHAFGTADAITLQEIDGQLILRIFDLKTGVTKASFEQLMVYAAYFCLEYEYKPFEFNEIILRIYQNDETVECPQAGLREDITFIMDRIVTLDAMLTQVMKELAS
jgi:Protein of unknown function (DUF2800).